MRPGSAPEREGLLVVGPGRTGIALGLAVRRARPRTTLTYVGHRDVPPDHPLFRTGAARYTTSLRPPRDAGEVTLITVPDDRIRHTAVDLAALEAPPEGAVALHASGALDASALESLAAAGYATGTLHPLQAIADPDRAAPRLARAWFAVSGSAVAQARARALVHSIGARVLDIPEERRALYHAAAVLVSNSLPALLATGGRLLTEAGAPPGDGTTALVPLVRSALENVIAAGPEAALTGPVARGDVATVQKNLEALDGEARELYVALARAILTLAEDGLGPERAEALRLTLSADLEDEDR